MQNTSDHAFIDGDLAVLRREHPERWTFRLTSANGLPLLVARHEDGALISARTMAGIERKIALIDGPQR